MPSLTGPSVARRATAFLAVGLTLSMVLIGCGNNAAPSVAADPAAACAASKDLSSSVEALDAVDLTTVTSADLQPSIEAVSSAAAQVIESAPGSVDQQAEDMEGAVNALEAAYQEASAGEIADSAAVIDVAIAGVKTQAVAMELALKPSCP
jgi:hypothetical protein